MTDDLLLKQPGIAVEVLQNDLTQERWQISPYNPIFRIIDSQSQKFGDLGIGKFMKGIDTGLDTVFEGKFINRFPNSYLVPRVAISYIQAFGYESPEAQIIYYTNETNWKDLPRSIQQYLLENRQSLEKRKSYQAANYEWFHLHRSRVGLF